MSFDSKPYDIKFIQKSSPTMRDDFLFVEIYTFITDKKQKYIIRAEMYGENTFTIKYYASIHKSLDDKYNRLTNQFDAHKIIKTCMNVFVILIEKYPDASFAINGSRTIDVANDKIERKERNQRFRIYSFVIDNFIGRKTFEHYVFPEISSYILVNRANKDINAHKDRIKEYFVDMFEFDIEI